MHGFGRVGCWWGSGKGVSGGRRVPLWGRQMSALRREGGTQAGVGRAGRASKAGIYGRPEPPPPPICPERKGIRGIGSLGAAPSPFRSSSGYRPGLLPKICMRLLRVQFRGPSRSGVGGIGAHREPRGEKQRWLPEAVSTFSSAFKKRWKPDLSRRRPRPPAPTAGPRGLVRGSMGAERCLVLNSR